MTDNTHNVTGNDDFENVAAASEALKKASGLLRVAALALRAAPHQEVREPVGRLIDNAKAAFKRALDGVDLSLACEASARELAHDIGTELYRLYSAVLVAGSVLNSPEAVSGEDICNNPTSGLLEICADMAGEDTHQGLCEQTEELLGRLYRIRKPKALELVESGGVS